MSYSAKIICDSISETNKRLTTFEITFPRIVLAEFNTHRMLSRNSASSRAIPFKKQIERISENPFIPEQFPLNCKGMQPDFYISSNNEYKIHYQAAKDTWLYARDEAIRTAKHLYNCLDELNQDTSTKIHKQIVNRLLEPFMWHTVIVTATEWDNFFKLRCNEDAQYEIKRIADLMYSEYHNPSRLLEAHCHMKSGDWHLPYIDINDNNYQDIRNYTIGNMKSEKNEVNIKEGIWQVAKRVSVARCARVSYLTHDGKRDIERDLELFERLRTSNHWSPFEHVATPYFHIYPQTIYPDIQINEHKDITQNTVKRDVRDIPTYENKRSGNFIGWKQFRKEFQDENCISFRKN